MAAGSHSEERRARLPRVPRDHALRLGGPPARFEPRGAVEDTVPAIRHELWIDITLSPIGIDDDFLPTAVVGIKLTQLGENSGSLVGEISLEEMWRMVDQIRVGDQGYALVVAANGATDRPWQLQ